LSEYESGKDIRQYRIFVAAFLGDVRLIDNIRVVQVVSPLIKLVYYFEQREKFYPIGLRSLTYVRDDLELSLLLKQ
jgi:hypothetical protein